MKKCIWINSSPKVILHKYLKTAFIKHKNLILPNLKTHPAPHPEISFKEEPHSGSGIVITAGADLSLDPEYGYCFKRMLTI